MSRETSQLPDEYEELDFVVQEENWNEYELIDDSRVKARSILRKIYTDAHNPNAMMFDFNPPIIAVYSTQSNRGERNNEPKPEEYYTLPSFEVKIQHNDEKWNRYRILKTDQEIRTKLIATEIRRIKNRYTSDGAPFYLFYSATPSVYMNPVKDALRP